MGRRQKATGNHLIRSERQAEAVELRKAGATFEQIGAALGITRQAAHQLVHRVLAQYDTTTEEAVEALRREEAAKLAAVHEVLWPAVMAGDLPAIDRWIKLSARASQLLGLDRSINRPPDEHQHLHVHTPQVVAYDREIARLLRERAQAAPDPGALPAPDVIEHHAPDEHSERLDLDYGVDE